MSAQSNRTPRIATRNVLMTFRTSFFVDDAMTNPLIPLDVTAYPSYEIIDINGSIMQSGVAIQDVHPGYWKVDYQVPKDACLSDSVRRWRIQWLFVDNDNRQVDFVEEFDVQDVVITADHNREIKQIALAGRKFLAKIRQTIKPHDIRLDVMMGNMAIPQVSNKTLKNGDIKYTQDGDSIVFYYEIPEGVLQLSNAGYNLLWEITETPIATPNYEFQAVYTVAPFIFQVMASLRMLIDKFQKKLGRVQAYEDSDVFEYLVQGLRVVNGWYPTTNYSMDAIPSVLAHHWILASGWWALNAQHLLETDLSFDFTGQTVTLNYNHTAELDAAIGRWYEFLTAQLTPTKMAVVRASTPVGAFAGRPVRLRALNNYVYKLQSFNSGSFMDVLSLIGLL